MISALGQCPIHHIDKMSVGSSDMDAVPICIKCKADAEPKTGRTQIVEDPGEGFFQGKGTNAKVHVVDTSVNSSGVGKMAVTAVAGTPQLNRAPLETYISQALQILSNAPMPKDLKQFKSLQKAIKILGELTENQNG